MPHLSIVVPTRATDLELLARLLACLGGQSFQDFETILVCDRTFSATEWQEFQQKITALAQQHQIGELVLISEKNADFTPQSPGGASYVRNQGILAARGKYLQLFDDDNEFNPEYLSLALSYHQQFKEQYGREVLITPSLMWRDTDQVQNQGFTGYQYRLARPQIHFLAPEQEYAEIKMFSGNGILGAREIMQQTLYDEQIAWIAEDLDFIYSIWKQGYPVLVFRDLKVRHQERDKSFLEQAWIGTGRSAQQKIKNIFLWVKKHANNKEKLIFFLRSSRGITVRLAIKGLIHGGKQRWQIFG